ncbi:MAG TPA: hypothetical protein VGQ54_04900, partial [Burkholderiales bacterium]|nr:hypothetical protein [Burkholderiales bacterium]
SLVGVGRGGLAAAPDGNSTSRYFADTSLPHARVDNPAAFVRSRATATAALSVLLAACMH